MNRLPPARVTVVVTTYNRSTLLREALDSVLAQTFRDFVVLVADNGSTDDTPEVVREYQRRDSRIHHRRQPRNIGINANLRENLLAAQTPYVAWLMDDDLWRPEHLEAGLRCLCEHRDAALYGCAAERFGEGETTTFVPPFVTGAEVSRWNFRDDFAPLLTYTPIVGSSLIVSRRALDSVPVWPASGGSIDWLLEGQLALIGPLIFNPAVLIRYRWHAANCSHSMFKGFRAYAETFYARRTLATLAWKAGSLKPERVESLVQAQDPSTARLIAISLASFGAPRLLRSAAIGVLRARPEILSTQRHYRIVSLLALHTGPFSFAAVDIASRVLGRWWPPKSV